MIVLDGRETMRRLYADDIRFERRSLGVDVDAVVQRCVLALARVVFGKQVNRA